MEEKLKLVQNNIIAACKRCNRDPKEVTLIAVSKTKPIEALLEAYTYGMRDFGENKVQEIVQKYPQIPSDAKLHMIGHLQRNKVKQVLPYVTMIHSVDSMRLAKEIQQEAQRNNQIVEVLLEVNVAKEESKHGIYAEEVMDLLLELKDYTNIKVCGLMTIAPYVENAENNRLVFRKLYELAVDIREKNIDNVTMDVLSMGMSGDYEVAIEEGATMIRVGTSIFGTR